RELFHGTRLVGENDAPADPALERLAAGQRGQSALRPYRSVQQTTLALQYPAARIRARPRFAPGVRRETGHEHVWKAGATGHEQGPRPARDDGAGTLTPAPGCRVYNTPNRLWVHRSRG